MDEWELGKGKGTTFFGYVASVSGAHKPQVLSGELKPQAPSQIFSLRIQGGCFHRLVGPEMCVSFKCAQGYFLGDCCTRVVGLRRSCAYESPRELALNAEQILGGTQ